MMNSFHFVSQAVDHKPLAISNDKYHVGQLDDTILMFWQYFVGLDVPNWAVTSKYMYYRSISARAYYYTICDICICIVFVYMCSVCVHLYNYSVCVEYLL